MIKWRWFQTEFAVSVWFPVMSLYLLYTDVGNITMVALTAALMHEIGHMAVLALYGDIPRRVVMSVFGVRFEMNDQDATGNYRKDFLVALAGPLVNGISALLLWKFSIAASQVHLALGIWNLLPLYPLDGERCLRSLMYERMISSVAEWWLKLVFWITWGLCFVVSIAMIWYRVPNPMLCILTVYTGLATVQRDRMNKSVV